MKYFFIVLTLFYASLSAATEPEIMADAKPERVLTLADLQEVNATTKAHAPLFYKDYDWDVGLIGGATFDGTQTEARRTTVGVGVYLGYHFNEAVTFHGEYIELFKTFTGDEATKDATNRIMAASVAFDFSAERTYSLYAKGGLGYEMQSKYNKEVNSPISLLGFGFRYMFTDQISGYVEGRWKFVLVNTAYPDNSLVGTVGLDYHFGLSDEKSALVDAVEKHNAPL